VKFGLPRDLTGVRFAVNVFIAATIVWYVLERIVDTNPIWAIASMVAASDPRVDEAARMFRARMINVAVGCVIGLVVLAIGHPSPWKIPLALSIAVLVSTYLVHIQTMWRQAPITAAIVIAGSLSDQSKLTGLEHGLHKVAEVIFGCAVGWAVSVVMARLWPLARPPSTSTGGGAKP
jgi:uncharacterized membrane protein YccC